MTFIVPELIRKTRDRQVLSATAIEHLVYSYAKGELPDYQMSAWLMAVYFSGLSESEIHVLTQAMLHSGEVVSFARGFHVDKHSPGGVGDKTSLIIAPLVAAAGFAVPMIAGRGLAHTGGTLDKLESIPGFTTQVSLKTFKNLV